jgi:DNA repair protein RecN (Recombination protein N)
MMLRYITVNSFALIDHLEVEFQDGLNLITGETGSGKSILVDAVALLTGARASQESIRQGKSAARVEGLFEVPEGHPVKALLSENGLSSDEPELVIRRELTRSGSNRVLINGNLTTLGVLSQIGLLVANIHGQNSHHQLLQSTRHLDYIDNYGDRSGLLGSVARLFRELEKWQSELAQIQRFERDQLQRQDLLRYQVSEIEGLSLRLGLDRELDEEAALLSTAERRLQAAQEAHQLLYEQDGSALALLDQAVRRLEELSSIDAALEDSAKQLTEIRYSTEDIAYGIRSYADAVQFDPARLEQVQEQLAELERVKRKYGPSLQDVLEYFKEAQAELERFENRDAEVERLTKQIAETSREYGEAAAQLSSERKEKSQELCQSVIQELSELAMQNTTFDVRIETHPEERSEKGIDTAEFLISPNLGEDPKPLVKIASGGELSRIMLALKSVLKTDQAQSTLVFDEVDSGIGGRTATVLGEKLSRLSKKHQVFCVTHLPQIAAFADRHFHVDKRREGERTVIEIADLSAEQRIEELSRMLGGSVVTQTTRRQAEEMLQGARAVR